MKVIKNEVVFATHTIKIKPIHYIYIGMKTSLILLLLLVGSKGNAQSVFNVDWTQAINGDDYNYYFIPQSFVTDNNNNCILAMRARSLFNIADTSFDSENIYGILLKLDTAGHLFWSKKFHSFYGGGNIFLGPAAVNSNSTLIATGYFTEDLYLNNMLMFPQDDETYESFLITFNEEGSTNEYFYAGDSIEILRIEANFQNNFIGIGRTFAGGKSFLGEPVNGNFFIFCINEQLELQWLVSQVAEWNYPHAGYNTEVKASDLIIDTDGNFYVSYSFNEPLNLNGNTFINDSYTFTTFDSIEVELDSFVYYFDTITYEYYDGLLIKYGPTGEEIWHTVIHGTGDEYITSIAVDPVQNVYITVPANFGDSIYFNNFGIPDTSLFDQFTRQLLVKLNASGEFINYRDETDSLAFFNNVYWRENNIYVPGQIRNTDNDYYKAGAIGVFDENLNLTDMARAYCPSPNSFTRSDVISIAFGDSYNYMLGNYDNCGYIDNQNLVDFNEEGGFISLLEADFSQPYSIPDSAISIYAQSYIYPIPAHNELIFTMNDLYGDIEDIHIYNQLGIEYPVFYKQQNKNSFLFDISLLHPGLYFISIMMNDTRRVYKVIKQ